MGLTRQPTQEDLLEQQHSDYINKVTESGMPLWYHESYNDSMYFSLPLDENEEVNRDRNLINNNTNNDEEDILPF